MDEIKRKLKIKKSIWSIMFDTLLPEKSILPAHPWANMAGRRNKNAFTFVLKLLIISQMQILDVKDVVCLFCLI